MVPGITDTECRIAEFRYQELLAEGHRQRRVAVTAAPPPASRVRITETIQRYIGRGIERVSRLHQTVRVHEPTNASAASGTLGMT